MESAMIDFESTEKKKSIIKVIGVGGGGGNAVSHMYTEGIEDVSFLICNTDAQALNNSPVPVRLQLGKEGLGAGDIPDVARQAAEESADDIKSMLSDGTKMTFITAGMGGGTGTGASPVIARISKELGILTVGIVTIPFDWEGIPKIDKALDGVEEIAKYVDALLVINNTRLSEVYSDLSLSNAFKKANETLTTAAKCISEIIAVNGTVNTDFNDVKTVLKDGGVAIISTGYGEGEGRVRKAIDEAISSPLLNDSDIYNSKKILLRIAYAEEEDKKSGLMMEETNDIKDFMKKFKREFNIKWGIAIDPNLGDKVKISILATGFGIEDIEMMSDHIKKRTEQEDTENEEKVKLREKYYGSADDKNKIKRRHQLYIFKTEDLDNEDIIQAVEETPAFMRTKQQLKDLQSISKTGIQVSKPKESKGNHVPIQGTISFGETAQ